jgi:hypothetical protein
MKSLFGISICGLAAALFPALLFGQTAAVSGFTPQGATRNNFALFCFLGGFPIHGGVHPDHDHAVGAGIPHREQRNAYHQAGEREHFRAAP